MQGYNQQQYYLQPPVPQYMNDGFYPPQYTDVQPISYPPQYPNVQYPTAPIQIAYIDKWDSGLCSCCEDCGICWSTICCCTCQTFNTKQDLNNGSKSLCDFICQLCLCPCTYTGLWCCLGWYECGNRSLLKSKIHYMNDDSDMCKVVCCLPCVVCQHRREIKHCRSLGQI